MPAVDMVALIKIDKLTLYGGRVERLNYNKFDFHFVGDYRLYIDRNTLSRHQIVETFCGFTVAMYGIIQYNNVG